MKVVKLKLDPKRPLDRIIATELDSLVDVDGFVTIEQVLQLAHPNTLLSIAVMNQHIKFIDNEEPKKSRKKVTP